jgi:hypothetical protein
LSVFIFLAKIKSCYDFIKPPQARLRDLISAREKLSLAMEIIQGNLKEGSEIEADVEDEQIVFRPL